VAALIFPATIELARKTATGLEVPESIVTELGAGKRPAVTVTIGDYSYRSTIASMGGRYMIPLSSDHRTASGLAAGDAVEVRVELDTAPRVVEVPDDAAAAIDAVPAARAFYDELSCSQQRRHIDPINDAKTPETRQRRIDKAVQMLRAGKK